MNTHKMINLLLPVVFILTVPACGMAPSSPTEPPPVPGTTAAQDVPLPSVPVSPHRPPAEVVFDLASANTVLPEGVLEEIRYYGGGGGPLAGFNMNFCQNEGQPTLAFRLAEITDMEILNNYHSPIVVTCGWQMDEQVTVTITNPGGQVYVQNETTSPEFKFDDDSVAGHYVALLWLPREIIQSEADNSSDLFRLHGIYQILPGAYQIKYEGRSGSVQTTIDIRTAPGGKATNSTSGGIILFDFEPNETIRIFYYPEEQPPVWHEYQIGSNGQLWIKEFPGSGANAILSLRSGELTTLPGPTSALNCGNALPTRTQRGRWLYMATFLRGEGLPLYAMPDSSSSITSIFPYESPRGHYVLAISEPTCGANSTWWKVQTLDNQIGWAMESDEHSYYLIDEFGPRLLSQDCDAEFVMGQAVRVTFTDGKPLNLRQAPDLSASILEKIPEGTRLIVRDGPRCTSDNTIWWHIEADTGISGWVAQGNGDVYFLEAWR